MKITFLKSAEKALRSYDNPTQVNIAKAISRLPGGDIKKLQGKKNLSLYRLRVGKYRIIFELNSNEIVITKIDSRGDVYKN